MSAELASKAAHGDLNEVVVAWLVQAMAAHIQGEKIETALGLDRSSRLRERNSALREAANILRGDDLQYTWATAGRLAKSIKRFESRIQPVLRFKPFHELSPVDAAIARAFLCGVPLPKTQRKLWDFLK